MSGYVDLHLHLVPGIDDGVRTRAESLELARGLRALGYERLVTTPHVRADMFPNRRSSIAPAFDALVASFAGEAGLPDFGLGAEHFVDETLLALVEASEAVPYPGERAILIELPSSAIPLGLASLCFRLRAKGLRPVLAHPERYAPLFHETDPLDPLLDGGVAPLLDLMSLVGRYGRAPQRAAERMLDEGVYAAACSDSHGPGDVPYVEKALGVLARRVGRTEAQRLLSSGPRSILDGTLED